MTAPEYTVSVRGFRILYLLQTCRMATEEIVAINDLRYLRGMLNVAQRNKSGKSELK